MALDLDVTDHLAEEHKTWCKNHPMFLSSSNPMMWIPSPPWFLTLSTLFHFHWPFSLILSSIFLSVTHRHTVKEIHAMDLSGCLPLRSNHFWSPQCSFGLVICVRPTICEHFCFSLCSPKASTFFLFQERALPLFFLLSERATFMVQKRFSPMGKSWLLSMVLTWSASTFTCPDYKHSLLTSRGTSSMRWRALLLLQS